MTRHLCAALRLHEHIQTTHSDGRALFGPDPGIRFNYRIGRFIKSYLPRSDWGDNLYYLQGQGYWVLANWELFRRTNDARYAEIATKCSDVMLERQTEDGAWEYPNPEWRGRIATAEGTWGSIGLLESYQRTQDRRYLEGAQRWCDFVFNVIGFQQVGDELAVNYFAQRGGGRIPNNTAFLLRFLAQLHELTGDASYLEPTEGLLRFMENAQKPSGEFPYAVRGQEGEPGRSHFQCFQYNAFECLDLITYWQMTGDERAKRIVLGLLRFLRNGLSEEGWAHYECGNRYRTVTYHTAVLAAAFRKAGEIGIDGYEDLAERAYGYVLDQQLPDGSFTYSQRDYRILSDRRSYPRYQTMILYHLLTGDPERAEIPAGKEEARGSVR